MYITINVFIGVKRNGLSYPIHRRKEITVIAMFSDNVQYEIGKLYAIMDPISDTKN